ncbi:hypothetical protein IW262DRAFT_688425 [Armillaria fumosa]|nr:hypothetical protein IW262DRAFT_688425 [Armillaria fumosa]
MTSRCPHLVFYLSILVTLLASSTCRLLYVRQGKAPLWSMIGLYVHHGIAAQCNRQLSPPKISSAVKLSFLFAGPRAAFKRVLISSSQFYFVCAGLRAAFETKVTGLLVGDTPRICGCGEFEVVTQCHLVAYVIAAKVAQFFFSWVLSTI